MALPDVEFLFEQGRGAFDLTGTFWTDVYDNADQVESFHFARSETELQSRQDLVELADSISRWLVPALHKLRWYPLVIRESERLPDERLEHESTDYFGSNITTVLNTQVFDYPIPSDLRLAPVIVDNPVDSDLTLLVDTDYLLDVTNGRIRFRVDPLTFGVITEIRDESGELVDRETTVWLAHSEWEREDLSLLFGYVVGLRMSSSANYSVLVNALFDAMLLGPSRATFDAALSAICDAPRAAGDEIVEEIIVESNRQVIVTDRSVYVTTLDAVVTVSVGQSVNQGDFLTDALKITPIGATIPSFAELAFIKVPSEMLLGGFSAGGLTFHNTATPTTVTTVLGRTKIEFPFVSDSLADATLFWDTVHANGILPGNQTLAQLLDLRPQPQTNDPDVNSLPAFINPMEFLIRNVIGHNAIIVTTKAASFGENNLGADLIPFTLRKLVPPQSAAFHVET